MPTLACTVHETAALQSGMPLVLPHSPSSPTGSPRASLIGATGSTHPVGGKSLGKLRICCPVSALGPSPPDLPRSPVQVGSKLAGIALPPAQTSVSECANEQPASVVEAVDTLIEKACANMLW